MCRIEEVSNLSLDSLCEIVTSQRGFTLRLGEKRIPFTTRSDIRYLAKDKIVIASADTKNDFNDKMIPHKEMRRILREEGVNEFFIDELKKKIDGPLVFIAKEPI